MQVKFNVTGKDRKELVKRIETITSEKAKYLGMPSAAYEVGIFTIDKSGTVNCIYDFALERLVHNLIGDGFVSEEEIKRETVTTQGLTVAIPREKVDLGKLEKIFENKGDLIKKALGITSLEIEEDEEKVSFPWFENIDNEHLMTYTKFIAALCKMSVGAKRINESSKEVINEKYAFRCFILRLGFIGDEFKKDRKLLLEKLSGSSAFKNGGHEDEISK
ncbi:MAG: virulence protein [Clostridiales bacterium]|nr:virulence protein [Clostridiales bacterium]MBS5877780.1 virulence protein [Clostridiales bacterium]